MRRMPALPRRPRPIRLGPLLGVVLACGAPPTACADEPTEPTEPPTDVTLAAEEVAAPDEDAAPTPDEALRDSAEPRPRSPYKWGGIGVPLVGYNKTDGLGFGVGGSVFTRRRDLDFGYRDMLTVSTFWTTNGKYTSNFLQYERRDRHFWVARLIYRLWSDMIYVGSGGRDVATVLPDELTRGNRVVGPSFLGTAQLSVPEMPFRVWVQAYVRQTSVTAKPGGLLDQERPYGANGGWYADVSAGLFVNEVDRWPLPNKGVVAQASVRGGFSTDGGKAHPIVGTNVEVSGWVPLAGQRLVLSGRGLFDKTWGKRPFYEKEWLGGTMRDEVAYDQMLVGYGRTRTRGDGVLAGLVDARVWLGRTRHPVFDASFTVDAWAELAWVFDGGNPGPVLPSVGLGPGILWQGATLLRPWVGWGWLAEEPGARRTPQALFGLALVEPL